MYRIVYNHPPNNYDIRMSSLDKVLTWSFPATFDPQVADGLMWREVGVNGAASSRERNCYVVPILFSGLLGLAD